MNSGPGLNRSPVPLIITIPRGHIMDSCLMSSLPFYLKYLHSLQLIQICINDMSVCLSASN